MNRKQSGQGEIVFGLVMIFLAFIAIAGWAAYCEATGHVGPAVSAAITMNDHAYERHGQDAVDATNCLNNSNNIIMRLFNPETNRYCLVGQQDGRTFLGIQEQDGSPVTTFEWKKVWEKLLHYLTNRGYQ